MCIENIDSSSVTNTQEIFTNTVSIIAAVSLIPTIIFAIKGGKLLKIFAVITILLIILAIISIAKPDLFIHACE